MDKYKKRYLKRNIAIFCLTIIIIFASWFLGSIANNSLILPYLKAILKDVYTLDNQRTYKTESHDVITYDKHKFELNKNDIDLISFVISGFSVFIGITIAVVMLFYKSNNIETILYELDDTERKILFNNTKELIKNNKSNT